MRPLLYTAVSLLASLMPSNAQEVTFRKMEMAPSNFTSFELTVKAPTLANSACVKIDVYREGKKTETLWGPGIITQGKSPKPLDLQAALHFDRQATQPSEGEMSMKWGGTLTSTSLDLTGGPFPFARGEASANFSPKSFSAERTPIFYILLSTDTQHPEYKGADTPEKLLKLNPRSIVLIGYLTINFMTID